MDESGICKMGPLFCDGFSAGICVNVETTTHKNTTCSVDRSHRFSTWSSFIANGSFTAKRQTCVFSMTTWPALHLAFCRPCSNDATLEQVNAHMHVHTCTYIHTD